MLAQIFATRVNAYDEPVGMSIGESMHIATVTRSQVQYDAIIVSKLFSKFVNVQFIGLSAPNCFHEKPPFCRVDEERQNGAGRTARLISARTQKRTAPCGSGTVQVIW